MAKTNHDVGQALGLWTPAPMSAHISFQIQHDTRDGHSTCDMIIVQTLRLEDSRRQKLVDLLGIVPNVSFQRKVSRVDIIHHQVLNITTECLSASLNEDDVIFAPESEHRHAARAEVLLPSRVQLQIGAIVVEKRQLYVRGALAGEQGRVERVRLRRDAGLEFVRHAVRVLPLCRTELQEREERLSLGSRR